MNFWRLLLGLFAVSYAAASKLRFRGKIKAYPRKVKMIPFKTRPGAPFPGVATCRNIRRELESLEVKDIDSAALERFWKPSRLSCVGGLISKSVYFQAYFKFPVGEEILEPDDLQEAFIMFYYERGLNFKWFPEGTQTDHYFQHEQTFRIDKQTCVRVYRVLGRPGNVIPLRLMILNARRETSFYTEWAETRDLYPLDFLALQLVELKSALSSMLKSWDTPKLLPFKTPAADATALMPLYSTVPLSEIERVASKIDELGYFQIRGYLRAADRPQVYILSSTVPVEVRIYTRIRRHILVAYKGRASKLTLTLHSGILHNIKIEGELNKAGIAGFTLQVYDGGHEFKSRNVVLIDPNDEEDLSDAESEYSDIHETGHPENTGKEQLNDSGSGELSEYDSE